MANTDRIQILEQTSATLVERVENFRAVLARHDETTSDIVRASQEIDRRLAILEHRVEVVEKKVDDLLARRWELWKLFLAAILGSLLTFAITFASKTIESRLGKHESATPVPQKKSP